MPKFVYAALPCALLLVSACDRFGHQSNSFLPPPSSTTTTADVAPLYSPVYADGESTTQGRAGDGGVSGYLVAPDGSISEVLVRLSEDGKTAFISIGGGAETEYALSTKGGKGKAPGSDGLTFNWSEDGASVFQTAEGHTGVIGLETPGDALPTGTVRYAGSWRTESAAGAGHGALSLDIDFDSDTLAGDLNGAYARPGLGGASPLDGTVSGVLTDSRFAGTILIASDDVSGSLDLYGAIYGTDGAHAAGVLGGTISGEGWSDAQSGRFDLNGKK